MSGPNPCPGEAKEWGEDAGAVKLGQGDDLGVRGGVEDIGDELGGGQLEGVVDDGDEDGVLTEQVTPVPQGDSEGGGNGSAGASQQVFQVTLRVTAARQSASASLPGSPVSSQPVSAVSPR